MKLLGDLWLLLLVFYGAAVFTSETLKPPDFNTHCHVFCGGQVFNICKPMNDCSFHQSASIERRDIVLKHNYYRRQVAIGNTSLPKAADMMYLTHDWNMEMAAHILVANCNATFYKECAKTSLMRRVALNTFVRRPQNAADNRIVDVTEAMRAWFDEIGAAPATLATNYDPAKGGNLSSMLFGGAVKVGCASSVDAANATYVACAYFPRPTAGSHLYSSGPPCSAPGCDVCTPYAYGLCDGPPPFRVPPDSAHAVRGNALLLAFVTAAYARVNVPAW